MPPKESKKEKSSAQQILNKIASTEAYADLASGVLHTFEKFTEIKLIELKKK